MPVKGRKVTILLVPDSEGAPRSFKFSLLGLRLSLILTAVAVVFFVIMAITWGSMMRRAKLADHLTEENEELLRGQQRVVGLEQRVSRLQQLEEQIRRVLGASATSGNRDSLLAVQRQLSEADVSPTLSASEFSDQPVFQMATPVTDNSFVNPSIIKDVDIPALWPVQGFISRGYEWDPILPGHSHAGVDIAAGEGMVVKATAGGVVVWSDWSDQYGNLIVIAHSAGYYSLYGHNQVVFVKPRQRVERGEPIALLGNTGQSSAPHLHFEIWRGNQPSDPQELLASP